MSVAYFMIYFIINRKKQLSLVGIPFELALALHTFIERSLSLHGERPSQLSTQLDSASGQYAYNTSYAHSSMYNIHVYFLCWRCVGFVVPYPFSTLLICLFAWKDFTLYTVDVGCMGV